MAVSDLGERRLAAVFVMAGGAGGIGRDFGGVRRRGGTLPFIVEPVEVVRQRDQLALDPLVALRAGRIGRGAGGRVDEPGERPQRRGVAPGAFALEIGVRVFRERVLRRDGPGLVDVPLAQGGRGLQPDETGGQRDADQPRPVPPPARVGVEVAQRGATGEVGIPDVVPRFGHGFSPWPLYQADTTACHSPSASRATEAGTWT